MANVKISDLPTHAAITDADLVESVDTEDTTLAPTGTNKKTTYQTIRTWLAGFFAPLTHVGTGGAEHPNAVASGASGFMTGADKTKLDGVATGANNYSHPNHTGDVTSVGDGAQTIAANAVTNTKIADDAVSTGKVQNLAITDAKLAANAVITSKIADDAVRNQELANMAANTVKLRAASAGDPTDSTIEALSDLSPALATDVVLGQKAGGVLGKIPFSQFEPAGALRNVVEDDAPQLGGELQTEGYPIGLRRSDGSYQGVLGAMPGQPGVYLVYSPDGTAFDPQDGGQFIEPGQVQLFGSTVLNQLVHSSPEGRQLYVSQNGTVYAVDAPAAGWEDEGTDATNTARTGAVGAWQRLANLDRTTQEDLSGERLDISAFVWTVNGTSNRSGTVEIGYGIGAAEPTAGLATFIPESTAKYVALSLSPTLTETAGQTIGIWVRVTSEDNPQFSSGLTFDGTVNNHVSRIATPGQAPGGDGDVIQGTGGSTGEVAVWQDFAGKLVHGTGIPATSVLRGDQPIALGTDTTPQVAITSATGAVAREYHPGTGPANGKVFGESTNNGFHLVTALEDDGTFLRTLLQLEHGGNILLSAAGIVTALGEIRGFSVAGPIVKGPGTYTVDLTDGPMIELAGAVTINPAASGEGAMFCHIDDLADITLNAAIRTNFGADDPGTGNYRGAIIWVRSGVTYFYIGASALS